MNRLLVCADDFGLTESVNKAILDIYNNGNLNLTSIMVNMPGTENAFIIANKNKFLNIGLHFNITEGKSILGISTLTNKYGVFYPRNILLKKILLGKINLNDIKNEFLGQLVKCQENGLLIKTIDSHQHVHLIPAIYNIISPEILKRNLSLRSCYANINFSLKRINHILTNFYLYKSRRQNIFRNSIITSIHHHGKLFDRHKYKNITNLLIDKFKITELMIHPYINSDDLLNLYKDEIVIKKKFLEACFNEYNVLSKYKIFDLN